MLTYAYGYKQTITQSHFLVYVYINKVLIIYVCPLRDTYPYLEVKKYTVNMTPTQAYWRNMLYYTIFYLIGHWTGIRIFFIL